jgi:dTDP-4-amino-4,6-dideoxy-D-galactose acyltransferase
MSMTLGARQAATVDRSFGAFELRRLDWDTTHFGQKMGVLAVVASADEGEPGALAADLRLSLREAADDGYAHVILRIGVDQLELARIAEQCGLRLVDVAVDHAAPIIARRAPVALGPSLRPVARTDVDALHGIAEDSFRHSRFTSDPFFGGERAAGFYRQWIRNLCDGLADIVFVAEASGEIAGFTSCARQADGTGRIPLIATSEDFRRQGIGRALIDASLAWFASAGIRTAYVKTQVANYPALALYRATGFTVVRGELTYSAMPNQPNPIVR